MRCVAFRGNTGSQQVAQQGKTFCLPLTCTRVDAVLSKPWMTSTPPRTPSSCPCVSTRPEASSTMEARWLAKAKSMAAVTATCPRRLNHPAAPEQ